MIKVELVKIFIKNFQQIILKTFNYLKNKDNLVLFLMIISSISLLKIAFCGINIEGSTYINGWVDTNTSILGDVEVEGSISIDGNVHTDTTVRGMIGTF